VSECLLLLETPSPLLATGTGWGISSPVRKHGECSSPQNTNKVGIGGQIGGQHLEGYSLPLQRCGQQWAEGSQVFVGWR